MDHYTRSAQQQVRTYNNKYLIQRVLMMGLGYPIATLPLSYLETNGCPFGLVAMAGAHQEALLVQVQAAWESIAPKRRAPPEVSV